MNTYMIISRFLAGRNDLIPEMIWKRLSDPLLNCVNILLITVYILSQCKIELLFLFH